MCVSVYVLAICRCGGIVKRWLWYYGCARADKQAGISKMLSRAWFWVFNKQTIRVGWDYYMPDLLAYKKRYISVDTVNTDIRLLLVYSDLRTLFLFSVIIYHNFPKFEQSKNIIFILKMHRNIIADIIWITYY